MNEEVVSNIESHCGSISLLNSGRHDSLSDPLTNSVVNPQSCENKENSGFLSVAVWHELAAEVKMEPHLVEVVKTEPQEFEFVKTEPEQVDVTEMILPDLGGTDPGMGNESVVMERECRLPVDVVSSQLKNELSYTEYPLVCHMMEMSMEIEDQPIQLEQRKEKFEFTVIDVEEVKGARISPHMDSDEFSHDHGNQHQDQGSDRTLINKYNKTIKETRHGENWCNMMKQDVTIQLKEKQFVCEQCSKRFCEKSSMKKHVRTVHLKEKQFECQHCGRGFGERSHMKKHIRTVHLKEKLFDCQHCGQRFSQKSVMGTHVKTVHLKEKEFQCPHCGQRFGECSNMKKHVRTVHLKEKEFECEHCGQRFGEKRRMKIHVLTVHLKERRFECQHCQKRFGQSCDLKKHILTVHLKEKLFKCEHCGQKFGQSSQMRKHVRNIHLKEKLPAR